MMFENIEDIKSDFCNNKCPENHKATCDKCFVPLFVNEIIAFQERKIAKEKLIQLKKDRLREITILYPKCHSCGANMRVLGESEYWEFAYDVSMETSFGDYIADKVIRCSACHAIVSEE